MSRALPARSDADNAGVEVRHQSLGRGWRDGRSRATTPPAVLVRLATERLVLREFEKDDWRAVLAYQSDPRYLHYYAWSARDEPAVREFVGGFVARQGEEPRHDFQLAITLPAEDSDWLATAGCG